MRIKYQLVLLVAVAGFSYSFIPKNIKSPIPSLEVSKDQKDKFLFNYDGKNYKPGDTVFGFKKYTKLVVGDIDAPLLLGVPHDGVAIGSPEIPETGTVGRDINTMPLAFKIAEYFKKSTKKRPWIIINTIGRKRVDPNTFPKEIEKRYEEDAIETYKSYHALLSAAREAIASFQKDGNGALFLDLHGQAHTYINPQMYISTTNGTIQNSKFIDQTELGYGISNYALMQDDTYLNKLADSSSIATLARKHPTVPFSEFLRGPFSFGGLLEAEKVHAVPGNVIKDLTGDELLFGKTENGDLKKRPYFNGGYCTRKYGTAKKGSTIGFDDNISAIQAETPGITVRNNSSIIEISGEKFNRAIINYLNKWYGYSFRL